ncbi:MAG: hypothetical protein KF749_04615 [Bacteroidetes bacterium]|nr:hypothetical protein [Bacteroidota bacterium]MCW5895449.1 hypothetical protein [Bacteroidota bacterium]
MRKTTTTKATYRGVEIVVLSDRVGNITKYACTNSCSAKKGEGEWFRSQGEAIANERYEIDRLLG